MKRLETLWIVVHSKAETIAVDDELSAAHAFGPFAGLVELASFEADKPDDCHKMVMALVVPPSARVILLDQDDEPVASA